MITDKLLQLSEAQAVTTTAVSENTIDLSSNRDIGEGATLYMHFAITEAFAGGTSVKFGCITSDNEDLSAALALAESDAIPVASLKLGDSVALQIPPQIASLGKRYIGARFTVVGTNSAGKVTTDIVDTIQDGRKAYPSGFVVK